MALVSIGANVQCSGMIFLFARVGIIGTVFNFIGDFVEGDDLSKKEEKKLEISFECCGHSCLSPISIFGPNLDLFSINCRGIYNLNLVYSHL